jgi:glycosyltransferase involved in cell wall biosynthesis
MASGLPVIASDIDPIREITSPSSAILVHPLDINGLSNAMHLLRKNPSLAAEMGKQARSISLEKSITLRVEKIRCWIEKLT